MEREIVGVSIDTSSSKNKPNKINPKDYRSQEVNKRYLTHTSVYLCLQKNLIKLIKLIEPKSILELGFGGTQTAVKVAKEYPHIQIMVVNTDCEMTDKATDLCKAENITNIIISNENVRDFVKNDLRNFDFIYLLYNFHHITDSTKRKREKIEFLADCFDNMKKGSYLCIADDFLPEMCDEDELEADESIEILYNRRAEETKASTFWSELKGVEPSDVHAAWEEAENSKIREKEASVKVKTREGEYLVKKSWLLKNAKEERFLVIIDKDVNSIGDAILLLKKI